jgi:hypothetical protein
MIWPKSRDKDGYGWQYRDGKVRKAHRVAYAESRGLGVDDLDGITIRHSCDNPSCINPEHLLAGGQIDNVKDRVDRDRSAKGERHGFSKLTESQVRKIPELRREGLTQKEIADEFGCHHSSISLIERGLLWKHIS